MAWLNFLAGYAACFESCMIFLNRFDAFGFVILEYSELRTQFFLKEEDYVIR